MRFQFPISILVLIIGTIPVFGQGAPLPKKRSIDRGFDAVRGKPPFSPPVWTMAAYENVWKQWGVKKKPADYDRAFRDRYGLHPAPYKNNGLPMGLSVSTGLLGKGFVNDCLLCHANVIAGQTVIGAGNSSLDLEAMFNELNAARGFGRKMPFHFSHVRGTIDPLSPVAFLLEFRDGDLNLKRTVKLDYFDNVCSDPPAWWLLKRKKTRQWTGNVDVRSVRVDMVNLLSPLNGAESIKKREAVFADIHAFVSSVKAPKYPFPVDRNLAAQGRKHFEQTCARCHGTYGPKRKYPNKIVPFKVIGTDPTLGQSLSKKNLEAFNNSWFVRERGPHGEDFRIRRSDGYQAPPLDGVWATAPYFHNGSAPTVYHVLNSKSRPKFFTRSYRTGEDEYDRSKLGWKITVLDAAPNPKLPGVESRKIYNTTLPGRSNSGHTFGDLLTEEQRRAVIEYLKTL